MILKLQIVRAADGETRGQRLVRRLRGSATSKDIEGMSTSEIMALPAMTEAGPGTLIDSCVLLDVAAGDERWADWSARQIAEAMDGGRVVINPLIYAEVSVGYDRAEELDEFLPGGDYEREPLPYRAGFAAGKAYLRYRRAGGIKRWPLPDFYIGAHAALAGYRLLTRDPSRYRAYFPTVELISP